MSLKKSVYFNHLECSCNTWYIYNHNLSIPTRARLISRKHIVQTTGLAAYSSTCFQWDREYMPTPWEQLKFHLTALAQNPLRNQFIYYHICSWGVLVSIISNLNIDITSLCTLISWALPTKLLASDGRPTINGWSTLVQVMVGGRQVRANVTQQCEVTNVKCRIHAEIHMFVFQLIHGIRKTYHMWYSYVIYNLNCNISERLM